ncbi:uncharacterized protein LOC34622668 [Cyclospora cayetanensis]|uniref:Uncharacterized protein LOC34622668 n=1 Tax=Cyclospora cayetanensis TaxID=88456 RepID=A0A6P6RTF2_9EIME|nr:uncharacterized protein LOC34622668 [Cyclospora cayetanensis]
MPSSLGLGWRALVVVAVNSAQPLLVDLAKSHGSPHPSCCLFVLPIFGSMALVGIFTCGDKRRLGISHWLRASYICLVDLAHQALEKAGLVYAGSALYLVASSFSVVWIALLSVCLLGRQLSALQWFGLATITAGFSLRVAQISSGSWEVGAHGASEILGMALVTAAQILHGLAFVLNEKYMTDTKAEIEGPQLVFMCGVINTLGLLLWTVFWTVPRWEVVALCFVGLTICSLLRSGVLWVILKHMGALSTGILKAVRMAVVTVLTHILFCQTQASQCLSPMKAAAASVVRLLPRLPRRFAPLSRAMFGVLVYSLATPQAAERQLQEGAKGKDIHRENYGAVPEHPRPQTPSPASPTPEALKAATEILPANVTAVAPM